MLKLLKNLIYTAILVAAAVAFWKFFSHVDKIESAPPLTPEQRAERDAHQTKQAVAVRLLELEQTHGAGRERLNKDVENAARILYNTRHDAHLPLVAPAVP